MILIRQAGEYEIDSQMEVGKVIISKDTIKQNSEDPEEIVIYYNDQILERIPIQPEEMRIQIEKSGWYAFFIVEDEQMIDISTQVFSYEEVEDNLLKPL